VAPHQQECKYNVIKAFLSSHDNTLRNFMHRFSQESNEESNLFLIILSFRFSLDVDSFNSFRSREKIDHDIAFEDNYTKYVLYHLCR
jgi:hypothetical protein